VVVFKAVLKKEFGSEEEEKGNAQEAGTTAFYIGSSLSGSEERKKNSLRYSVVLAVSKRIRLPRSSSAANFL